MVAPGPAQDVRLAARRRLPWSAQDAGIPAGGQGWPAWNVRPDRGAAGALFGLPPAQSPSWPSGLPAGLLDAGDIPTPAKRLRTRCGHNLRSKSDLPSAFQVIDFNGLFGERGGTRTLDPMIKSHVP
jgi:hypothetical protein